jgi:hypothetical protein
VVLHIIEPAFVELNKGWFDDVQRHCVGKLYKLMEKLYEERGMDNIKNVLLPLRIYSFCTDITYRRPRIIYSFYTDTTNCQQSLIKNLKN